MRTIQIRIPVAVNSQGLWNVSAWNDVDGMVKEASTDGLDSDPAENPEHLVWVVADIPIPDPRTEHEAVGFVEKVEAPDAC